MDAQEKEKKLKLMRFWLVGTFAIFFAAITIYFGALAQVVGVVVNANNSIFTNLYYWIFIIILALLCVGAWYIYKKYLDKK